MLRRMEVIALVVYVLISIAITARGDTHTYTYTLDDNIPRHVQKEAIDALLVPETGVLGKPARGNSISNLLDQYLRFYGIFCPDSEKNGIAAWTQRELLADTDRTTEIPARFVTTKDLTEWVERYAEPGDLLLYRANGRADRCMIYAGNGKIITRVDDIYRIMPMQATYVVSDQVRTRASGLVAISHIWAEGKNKSSERHLDVLIEIEPETNVFSGDQYVLYLRNNETGLYERTSEAIAYEYKPGVYRIWNGKEYGISIERIIREGGLHLELRSAAVVNGEISRKLHLDMPIENIQNLEDLTDLTISVEEKSNTMQWNGKDLLNALGGISREN